MRGNSVSLNLAQEYLKARAPLQTNSTKQFLFIIIVDFFCVSYRTMKAKIIVAKIYCLGNSLT